MLTKSVFAAISLLALGACATASQPVISPLQTTSHPMTPETARTLAAKGYYTQATIAYRAALKANPEDASARHGLAEALRRTGKTDEAKAEFTALLSNPEWKVRALEGLGWISATSGYPVEAFGAFNQAVADDAQAWRAWLGLAQLHDLNKDWVKADEAYAAALGAAEERALVLNNHGVSKLARNDAASAAELFRGALAEDAKLERAKINLALAEAVSGKPLEAVSASEQDARERAKLLNNHGYVAMLQGRPEEARAFYQAALKEHPSFYAQAHQNMKVLDSARANAE